MRRLLPCLLALLALGAATACRSRTEVELPRVQTSRLDLSAKADAPWEPDERYEVVGGPWQVSEGNFAPGATVVPAAMPAGAVDPFAGTPRAAPSAPRAVIRRPPPRERTLAVPRRRARKEARPVGQKTDRTPEQLAREHFLDYPTRVKARKITLYLPPAYVPAVRLSGRSVTPMANGRRMAMGGARLLLRELTLEAERITLRQRSDGLPDVQIMARGEAGFVADVRANVLREEGLRSLLITNDQVVPIR